MIYLSLISQKNFQKKINKFKNQKSYQKQGWDDFVFPNQNKDKTNVNLNQQSQGIGQTGSPSKSVEMDRGNRTDQMNLGSQDPLQSDKSMNANSKYSKNQQDLAQNVLGIVYDLSLPLISQDVNQSSKQMSQGVSSMREGDFSAEQRGTPLDKQSDVGNTQTGRPGGVDQLNQNQFAKTQEQKDKDSQNNQKQKLYDMKANPDFAKKEEDSTNAKIGKSSEATSGSRVPTQKGLQSKLSKAQKNQSETDKSDSSRSQGTRKFSTSNKQDKQETVVTTTTTTVTKPTEEDQNQAGRQQKSASSGTQKASGTTSSQKSGASHSQATGTHSSGSQSTGSHSSGSQSTGSHSSGTSDHQGPGRPKGSHNAPGILIQSSHYYSILIFYLIFGTEKPGPKPGSHQAQSSGSSSTSHKTGSSGSHSTQSTSNQKQNTQNQNKNQNTSSNQSSNTKKSDTTGSSSHKNN